MNLNEIATIDFCFRGAIIPVMKYSFSILLIMALFSVTTSGCALLCGVPPEAKQTAEENAGISDGFVLMMDAGTTTREQDQKFIHANRRAWHAQNYALNDVLLPRDIEIWFKKYKLGLDPASSAPIPENPPR